jgi:carbonic anhydrase/acetyltransferase-like protein (isoleucine patch superfamily)
MRQRHRAVVDAPASVVTDAQVIGKVAVAHGVIAARPAIVLVTAPPTKTVALGWATPPSGPSAKRWNTPSWH